MTARPTPPLLTHRLARRTLPVLVGAIALWAWHPVVGQDQTPIAQLSRNTQSPPSGPLIAGPDQQVATRDEVPAHLAVLEGTVTLERDNHALAAELNDLMLAGDRLRTDRGRAEVLFGDNSSLDVDVGTTVEFLSDSLVRLHSGRLRIAITRLTNQIEYRVDAAGSSVNVASAGDFRISLIEDRRLSPTLELAVVRGSAELTNSHGQIVVRSGQHATAREDEAPSNVSAFNTSGHDDFDAWVDDQRQARVSSESSQYLPSDLSAYGGALDSSGTWQDEPSYGTVWYPQVAYGWQPYSFGHWCYYGNFGWFWVGGPAWVWPTHHFGRWGVASGRWFWVPGRQFSPAWVTWGSSPGMIGWSPAGLDGHAMSNAFPDARRGWTTVSTAQFGRVTAATSAPIVQGAQPQLISSAAPPAPKSRPITIPVHSPTSMRLAAQPIVSTAEPVFPAPPVVPTPPVITSPFPAAPLAPARLNSAPPVARPHFDGSTGRQPGHTSGEPEQFARPRFQPVEPPRATVGAGMERGSERGPEHVGSVPASPPAGAHPPARASGSSSHSGTAASGSARGGRGGRQ